IGGLLYGAQLGQLPDGDQQGGAHQPEIEHRPERLTAREQPGAGLAAQSFGGLRDALREHEREGRGLHAGVFARAASSAAMTRCGVIGRRSIDTPSGRSASLTALAIAAGGPMAPPSPIPFWPNS